MAVINSFFIIDNKKEKFRKWNYVGFYIGSILGTAGLLLSLIFAKKTISNLKIDTF